MNTSVRSFITCIALLTLAGAPARAVDEPRVAPDTPTVVPAAPIAASPDTGADVNADGNADVKVNVRIRRSGNELVAFGHDVKLGKDEAADAVVAIVGSATNEGTVAESVVAILGSARSTGPVGDSVVAVLGNTYVDGPIGGQVVSVLGTVELGPNADVAGDVVSVGGAVKRDPAARVEGDTESMQFGTVGELTGLKVWFRNCLLYARPLAFQPGLGWAWGLAIGFLAFYILLAVAARRGIEQCVRTFESRPGQSLLAALLTVLLTPVLMVLLVITVVGIVAVPFVGIGLFAATLFGKAVMLAWMGGSALRLLSRPAAADGEGSALRHPALAVLLGGVVVMLLYTVPVLGFVLYKLLGIIGLGVVVYTLVLAAQNARAARIGSSPASGEEATAATADAAAPFAAMTAEAAAAAANARPAAATTPPAPPVMVASTLPRAGFWIRMGALLIDAVLIGIVIHLVWESGRVLLLALALYGAVMWKLKSTTIGGSIFGLQVVRTDGRAIDWTTAIVRGLSCLLSAAIAGLGFFWIAFDKDRQGWHDKIAGTAVVRVPKGVSLL